MGGGIGIGKSMFEAQRVASRTDNEQHPPLPTPHSLSLQIHQCRGVAV